MKETLTKHLQSGAAFTGIDDFIDDIPFDKLGIRPQGLPYSFYEIFYHIYFAQKDILDFCTADTYGKHAWPDDYWPKKQKPDSEKDWGMLKSAFFTDRKALEEWLNSEENKLEDVVKNGKDQTIFREVLLVLEHNAYHTGQLMILARLLGEH